MSHGIIKPIDKVLSILGTEWHGLADHMEKIGDEEIAPLLFPILTGEILVKVGEDLVKMKNHKPLIADLRACRPDLIDEEDTSKGLVPLHIPKNSYRIIENREVWEAMKAAVKEVDAVVSSAGTLEAGKKFFMSIALNKGEKYKINGDEFLANLNFVTSHDGTMGFEIFDSMTRQICKNTVQLARSTAGDIGFKVYHSLNSDMAMKNIGELVNRVLLGRADFKTDMEYLAKQNINSVKAEQIILGYFASLPGFDSVEGLTTRAKNQTQSIIDLFTNGKGNHGKTLFDLLNGCTEYWTGGDGTGKSGDGLEKMYKATFGKAADHKSEIYNALMSEERVKELAALGKKGKLKVISRSSIGASG